jgi:hypothetical protein
MPLAFESMSHGTIAFGFFSIDSDMLLLEQYFLFGSEFCLSRNLSHTSGKAGIPVGGMASDRIMS